MPLSDAELATHLTGIGSSSAWRALTAPIDAYLLHTGLARLPPTQAMGLGNALEDGIATAWAQEHGRTLRKVSTRRHPERDWQIAHIDRWSVEDECPLEIKLVGIGQARNWGEPGTDEIPEPYIVQVQHQMAVLGSPRAIVAALICSTELRTYEVKRDEELIGILTEAEERLWTQHIIPRVPPPMADSALAAMWLAARFPAERTPMRFATDEERELMRLHREARAERLNAKKWETELELQLKEAIGEAAGIFSPGLGRVAWRANKHGKRNFRPQYEGLSEENDDE